jgi:carbon-monoxide dehydrogenase medium subunit
MALDAQAEIAGLSGSRRVPLADLFSGPGKNTLQNELIVGFYLCLKEPGEASAFKRVMRPQGVAIAILNLGVWLRRDGDSIAAIRISVGPSGPVPRRMQSAEGVLNGQVISDNSVEKAYRTILAEASFRTSRHRATTDYRQHVVGVLLKETLQTAFERAIL